MVGRKGVLLLVLVIVFSSIDEENIITLSALLQHDDTDRNTRRVKQVGGQADDAVNVVIGDELFPDSSLRTTTEKDSVRKNNGHGAAAAQVMEAVQQKGEVCRTLGRDAIVLKTRIL